MEGIVFGVANINFQTIAEFDENRTPNCMQNNSDAITMAPEILGRKLEVTGFLNDGANNETAASTSSNDDDWLSEDEVDVSRRNTRTRGCTFAERRQLPSRASKESSLSSVKRRTIMKPAKHTSSIHKDFNNLKPAEIKKIYMNKKLTNFRPSSLETIFEEPASSQTTSAEYNQVRFIGARKLRRTLACTDGFVFNNNKALVKKRRAKIKKAFGRRLALKKISLEDFLEKLNNSMEDTNSTDQPIEDMAESQRTSMTEAFVNIPAVSSRSEDMLEYCRIPIQTNLTTAKSKFTSSLAVVNASEALSMVPVPLPRKGMDGTPNQSVLFTAESKLNSSSSVNNKTNAFPNVPPIPLPSEGMDDDCCTPIQTDLSRAESEQNSSSSVINTPQAFPSVPSVALSSDDMDEDLYSPIQNNLTTEESQYPTSSSVINVRETFVNVPVSLPLTQDKIP